MKNKKATSTLVLIELILSIAISVFVFYFQNFLNIEAFANQLVIILLFVGFFITISTYTLKNHITHENQEQNEEYKRNFEIVRLIAAFMQKINDEERLNLAKKKIKKTLFEIEKLTEGFWDIVGVYQINLLIKKEIEKTALSIQTTHRCPKNWESSVNQEILTENKKAITEKNVEIKRVFLLNESDVEKFIEIKKILISHSETGVKVKCVRTKDLDSSLVKDFLIFDEKKVIVEDIVVDKTEYENAKVIVNKDSVNMWIDKFKHIEDIACDIDKFEKDFVK